MVKKQAVKNKMDAFSSGSEKLTVRMSIKQQNVKIGERDRIMGKEANFPNSLYSLWYNHI